MAEKTTCITTEILKRHPELAPKWMRMKRATESDYPELVQFFMDNGLEYGDEDKYDTDTDEVASYKVMYGDELAGAVCLAKRDGEFIIDGIAVKEEYRKKKLGKLLLDKAISTAKELGATSIYLNARAPKFYEAYGFKAVKANEAPFFYECLDCDQYGKTCHPEIMKYVIK